MTMNDRLYEECHCYDIDGNRLPTAIEQGYVDQGYVLPMGWSWERVAEDRAKYDVAPICVPVAFAGGVVAWGVPRIGKRFMYHP